MAVKRRYFLFLCPECGLQHQFAGFCDSCGTRLRPYQLIPVETITEHLENLRATSSPVPQWFQQHFVDSLLDFSKPSSG